MDRREFQAQAREIKEHWHRLREEHHCVPFPGGPMIPRFHTERVPCLGGADAQTRARFALALLARKTARELGMEAKAAQSSVAEPKAAEPLPSVQTVNDEHAESAAKKDRHSDGNMLLFCAIAEWATRHPSLGDVGGDGTAVGLVLRAWRNFCDLEPARATDFDKFAKQLLDNALARLKANKLATNAGEAPQTSLLELQSHRADLIDRNRQPPRNRQPGAKAPDVGNPAWWSSRSKAEREELLERIKRRGASIARLAYGSPTYQCTCHEPEDMGLVDGNLAGKVRPDDAYWGDLALLFLKLVHSHLGVRPLSAESGKAAALGCVANVVRYYHPMWDWIEAFLDDAAVPNTEVARIVAGLERGLGHAKEHFAGIVQGGKSTAADLPECLNPAELGQPYQVVHEAMQLLADVRPSVRIPHVEETINAVADLALEACSALTDLVPESKTTEAGPARLFLKRHHNLTKPSRRDDDKLVSPTLGVLFPNARMHRMRQFATYALRDLDLIDGARTDARIPAEFSRLMFHCPSALEEGGDS